MRDIVIKNRTIGENKRIFINAEMACSHNGNISIAKKVIDTACNGGADAINFQMVSMKDYMVRYFGKGKSGKGIISAGKDDSDIYQYIDSLMFDENEWSMLFEYARKKDILICAQPNDYVSFEWARKLNPDIYSISSATFSEIDLVKKIACEDKPMILRIGGALLGEIEKVVSAIQLSNNDKIIIMYGFQNYPTEIDKINLHYMKTLKELFGTHIGFADHTDGGDEMALKIPLLAIPLEVAVLEKHITHNREEKCEDYESALDEKTFKKFVEDVRVAQMAMGNKYFKGLSEGEVDYRNKSKKRVVAKVDLNKGDVLSKDNVVFKRADFGFLPEEAKYLYNRRLSTDICADQIIELTDLE